MEYLKLEHRDRVALLTLNDPERRNVVSNELNEELVSTFDKLEKSDDTGAVVITGEGRAFCAGAILDDLLDAGEMQKQGDEASLPHIYRGFLRIAHSTLPTVAAVNGAAVGAGMNMVLACDLVIAGVSARFDTRFLNIGLHPGGGHTWRLRNIT
ncbi:MAG: enoyl-CoA hydratase-related protein, partial [Acidimicrobiales bacterium]|nr:enoyl-CoA hydratase-related protein [Acidimicrobiales bacterium]